MSEFDSKKICWICLKPYDNHTTKDWEQCTKENKVRGFVIEEFKDILKKSGRIDN